MIGGFPSQRGSNFENIYMSCRHNASEIPDQPHIHRAPWHAPFPFSDALWRRCLELLYITTVHMHVQLYIQCEWASSMVRHGTMLQLPTACWRFLVLNQWLNARLSCLQCVSNVVTAVFCSAFKIVSHWPLELSFGGMIHVDFVFYFAQINDLTVNSVLSNVDMLGKQFTDKLFISYRWVSARKT